MPFERVALGLLIGLIVWAPFPLGSNRGDFNRQIPANAFAFMLLLAFGWLSLYLAARAYTLTGITRPSCR